VTDDHAAPAEPCADHAFPLLDMPSDVAEQLERVGGHGINLYRALANAPDMLRAYLGMAWGLRLDPQTPRTLRELVILRGAQVAESEYEWEHHIRMARSAGVPEEQIEAVGAWRDADVFSPAERAALALAEELGRGSVSQATSAELARHFSTPERVELIVTGSFYVMVARLLDAMDVPLEEEDRLPSY
jgi:alkylhydroperoxidase family enzyme